MVAPVVRALAQSAWANPHRGVAPSFWRDRATIALKRRASINCPSGTELRITMTGPSWDSIPTLAQFAPLRVRRIFTIRNSGHACEIFSCNHLRMIYSLFCNEAGDGPMGKRENILSFHARPLRTADPEYRATCPDDVQSPQSRSPGLRDSDRVPGSAYGVGTVRKNRASPAAGWMT